MNAIEIENLTVRYGTLTAVNGISLSIAQGEIFGLVGPNGAGKTTTLKVLSGLLYPDGGTARVTGRDVCSEPDAVRSNIGYMADLAYATAAAANRVASPPATYNVTGSEIVTCREVDLVVADELGIEPMWVEADEERDRPLYLADIGLMCRDLWVPRFGMELAVRKIVRANKNGIREVQDWMFEFE